MISTALQLQAANIIPFPIVAKVLAELLVFVFNFLFLVLGELCLAPVAVSMTPKPSP